MKRFTLLALLAACLPVGLASCAKDEECKVVGPTNLTGKNTGLETNIADPKAHILSHSDGRLIDGLKTEIRAVYNGWGFVTLADGDNADVVPNSTLDVVRGDEVIAKLLVTIVKQNYASADIVPGSMAPETSLMTGDLVVPAEVRMPGDQST